MTSTRRATCAEVETDAAEEVVADEPVVVPDGQLDAAVLELGPADALEHERVVPRRVAVAPHHRTLVRRRARAVRQQATIHATPRPHVTTSSLALGRVATLSVALTDSRAAGEQCAAPTADECKHSIACLLRPYTA